MQREWQGSTFRPCNCRRRNRDNCIALITAMLTDFAGRSESRKLPRKLRTPDLSASLVTFPLGTTAQFKSSFTFYHVISDRRAQITQLNIRLTSSRVRCKENLNLSSRCSRRCSIVKITQSSLHVLNYLK